MRYFLELAYNGKNYFGYQIQPNQISVQEVIEDRLSKILRKKISIVGAGRTDAGVHAKKMYIHFDYEEELNVDLIKRLNSFLPKDIAVAHMDGDIHIHDMDFYMLTETCCQIDLDKLFKSASFVIISEPISHLNCLIKPVPKSAFGSATINY